MYSYCLNWNLMQEAFYDICKIFCHMEQLHQDTFNIIYNICRKCI